SFLLSFPLSFSLSRSLSFSFSVFLLQGNPGLRVGAGQERAELQQRWTWAVTAPPLCATSHCRRKSCPTGSGAHTRPPSATTPRPGRGTGNQHTHTHTQREYS